MYTFNGHEFEQTLGDSRRQRSLEDYSPWNDRVRRDIVTEQHIHMDRHTHFLPFEILHFFFTNWRFAATLGYQMIVSFFFWLSWVLLVAFRIFDLSFDMWDLVPWPLIRPRPPALGAGSLSHWTTRDIPAFVFLVIQCFFKKILFLLIYLTVPGLNCGMWDLVPWPGIEPGPPILTVQRLSHWTNSEVSSAFFFHNINIYCFIWILYWKPSSAFKLRSVHCPFGQNALHTK